MLAFCSSKPEKQKNALPPPKKTSMQVKLFGELIAFDFRYFSPISTQIWWSPQIFWWQNKRLYPQRSKNILSSSTCLCSRVEPSARSTPPRRTFFQLEWTGGPCHLFIWVKDHSVVQWDDSVVEVKNSPVAQLSCVLCRPPTPLRSSREWPPTADNTTSCWWVLVSINVTVSSHMEHLKCIFKPSMRSPVIIP